MKSIKRALKSLKFVVLLSTVLAGVHGTTITTKAQGLRDLQTQRSPLALKAMKDDNELQKRVGEIEDRIALKELVDTFPILADK